MVAINEQPKNLSFGGAVGQLGGMYAQYQQANAGMNAVNNLQQGNFAGAMQNAGQFMMYKQGQNQLQNGGQQGGQQGGFMGALTGAFGAGGH